ncbi:MAG TPA: tetratricopeptide repeat protein [Terracidiphilus sp.]|jgi:tetratricopeptide (TPR) repeat protein|nr:tetratricopeptide repeat protein [Terracidiphilus sp.]
MMLLPTRSSTRLAVAVVCVCASISAYAQSSSSQPHNTSSSSSSPGQLYAQEKAPSLIDPAGPTISLISSEPVFIMATALNACGYDEGLDQSAPVRKRVRDEINQALAKSEDARTRRDALCLYIAQHRMTGTEADISQYVSLSLYLTPPPDLEVTADLTEMPPDATQVAEIVPVLKAFAEAVDLHGIWLTVHRTYDDVAAQVHDSLSAMIVDTNLYLKMPASTYDGRRFIVVIEPMLSPSVVNARIYGTDYIVVVSPVDGKIRMTDVRHAYLHYVIDPLLLARANAVDRTQPILKEIREAPIAFRYRSDTVPLTIECLIKAIEARTMDTGVPIYKIPTNIDRSELPRYEHQRQVTLEKAEAVRVATVQHDMSQGFVLTQYFYEQMLQFEKDPASLKDTIGEMVYSMDVDQQVHRARQTVFDKEADEDVLQRSQPHKLSGLDLAEAKLSTGDAVAAREIADKVLADKTDSVQSVADSARAHFILARVDLLTQQPDQAVDEFQKTLATSKQQRLLAWSHIYLGRMLDLQCNRDAALAEYKEALVVRDGEQDTRIAAERGIKAPYTVKGQACDDDDSGDDKSPAPTGGQAKAGPGTNQNSQ